MNAIGTINANQSDILLKMQHSIVAYLAGTMNKFNGKVEMKDDEVEKASFEFSLNTIGPCSFTIPNNDEHPGPPLSHNNKGSEEGFL